MAVKNNLTLGRDVMKQVCDVLNIEYDKEKILGLKIEIHVDGIVKVEKEFYTTNKEPS